MSAHVDSLCAAAYNTLELIGESSSMADVRNKILKYANSDAEVLIQGETGVGKGLCAKLIHKLSARRDHPFIDVNCGSIASGLIASELFGHQKGAFTGAISDHIGYIQRSHNGTLFLDEIGDMPPDLQIHLLHFLESKKMQRLGSDSSVVVNCRIIAASHVDLKQDIIQGGFREDLYYRLNILPLFIPPLRERKVDITGYAQYFLNVLSDGKKKHLTKPVLDYLSRHSWPGNVRELRNVIQRAIIMCGDKNITIADLGLEIIDRQMLPASDTIDSDYLLQVISDHKHNMSAAARYMGISRTTLYRLLKKYNLQK
ncbi:sigma-54-dependent Fis family transcriptional regulator [Vibrio fluvialis]|nr:sigma-54-dependent Fis family transcriptional regulator [Vibrio fluvialis]EKO3954071.1 sigma-54-dependent Fis family transcriptional regulator [Vibrio fluvialis]EKO3999515.1 sigma-54-dependent Fis family transcriptional regulator [Vibrio fluvialis]EKO4003029.1 sigma-54-dependent Fis family transcriptional regulator [Vibrio fluvialis]ELG2041223.1 sigma-54-dependent Fis family transcriptional regulator [Vibrio fluvialis]